METQLKVGIAMVGVLMLFVFLFGFLFGWVVS